MESTVNQMQTCCLMIVCFEFCWNVRMFNVCDVFLCVVGK
jgi:uncharacterized membrane protein